MTRRFPEALSTGILGIVMRLIPHAGDAFIRDDVEHAVQSERAYVASLARYGFRGGVAASSAPASPRRIGRRIHRRISRLPYLLLAN
jgi:hypothetical protein